MIIFPVPFPIDESDTEPMRVLHDDPPPIWVGVIAWVGLLLLFAVMFYFLPL